MSRLRYLFSHLLLRVVFVFELESDSSPLGLDGVGLQESLSGETLQDSRLFVTLFCSRSSAAFLTDHQQTLEEAIIRPSDIRCLQSCRIDVVERLI